MRRDIKKVVDERNNPVSPAFEPAIFLTRLVDTLCANQSGRVFLRSIMK
jgi:hypothetical protein